jgi:hypothetical protein
MKITLTSNELAELDRQNPTTKDDGGWQNLLVTLRNKVDRATRELTLSPEDLERIPRYAFDYGRGGWEDRLLAIFGRTLGLRLGRPAAA